MARPVKGELARHEGPTIPKAFGLEAATRTSPDVVAHLTSPVVLDGRGGMVEVQSLNRAGDRFGMLLEVNKDES
jgi:hypothetical protein